MSVEERINIKYLNARVQNTDKNKAVPAVLNITRDAPVINNPHQWEMAVSSFQLPTDEIPVINGGLDQDIVTLGFDNGGTMAYFSYSVGTNDQIIYNLWQFIAQVNEALGKAYVDLVNAGGRGNTKASPWMFYEEGLRKFRLVTDEGYVSNIFPPSPISIYFSYHLYQRFGAFDAAFLGFNEPGNRDICFYLRDNGENNYDYTFSTPVSYPTLAGGSGSLPTTWKIFQQYGRGNVTDIQGLIITSNTLPILSEDTVEIGSALGSNSAAQGNLPVMISYNFDLQQFTLPQDVVTIVYDATLYRWIHMSGGKPLRDISIRIYVNGRDGSITPLMIAPNRTFSVKLAFRAKTGH